MANLTFKTPDGDRCSGCLALDGRRFYCEFFNEFLRNEHGNAGYLKCTKCKLLGKYGIAKQPNVRI